MRARRWARNLTRQSGRLQFALYAIKPPFLLGVDVGHPLDRRESWVAMSLLDHRGVHLESWRCRQQRDETIRPDVLRKGLTWAREAMQRHGAAAPHGVLVLRDGRLHKGETLRQYRAGLNVPLTLVEIDKRRNPEMFVAESRPRPAPAGTEVMVGAGRVRFIAPIPQRKSSDLARVLKLCMAEDADGLGLGFDTVTEIIMGLSYSPSLGLSPHGLPGPIYWADGIAAIGETNHQFSGQKAVLV